MSADPLVLIVDDEPNVRRVLSALLRRDGYRTLEAGDGEEALRSLDANPVHAVVADLKMPRMNGLELLDEVAWSITLENRVAAALDRRGAHPGIAAGAESTGSRLELFLSFFGCRYCGDPAF